MLERSGHFVTIDRFVNRSTNLDSRGARKTRPTVSTSIVNPISSLMTSRTPAGADEPDALSREALSLSASKTLIDVAGTSRQSHRHKGNYSAVIFGVTAKSCGASTPYLEICCPLPPHTQRLHLPVKCHAFLAPAVPAATNIATRTPYANS